MTKRVLLKSRIKEGCLEEYVRLHDEQRPELIAEYKRFGIQRLSCFIDGRDLYVLAEFDESFDLEETPKKMPLDIEFSKSLEPVKDWSVPVRVVKEVYHME